MAKKLIELFDDKCTLLGKMEAYLEVAKWTRQGGSASDLEAFCFQSVESIKSDLDEVNEGIAKFSKAVQS